MISAEDQSEMSPDVFCRIKHISLHLDMSENNLYHLVLDMALLTHQVLSVSRLGIVPYSSLRHLPGIQKG